MPTMTNRLTKLLGNKKEWKAMEARADALPHNYRIVYGEMKSYLWRFTNGDGVDIIAILNHVLGLFEAGASEGKTVLQVTGDDVAAFCGELLRGSTSYQDRWQVALNRDVARKLAE
jgi:DNA-binding ferritin-like protein (Dps family)